MPVSVPYRLGSVVLSIVFLMASLHAAQNDQPSPTLQQPALPEIVDEPRTVDPATLMPTPLAVPVTVDFSDSSLREILDWLNDQQNVVALLESKALSEIGLSPSEPVSDRLDDAPIYLLLNRLRLLDLAWYFDDNILHITSSQVADERLTTLPVNVGDLLDIGYDMDDLAEVIEGAIDPANWASVGGEGVLSVLGDVMFIRQTDRVQRQVQGLLAALRNHGRQTFVFDPPQHLLLRQKLDDNVSVDFLDAPLVAAVEQLAHDSAIDIRLDTRALRDARIREREPVTLKLTDRKLKTVLQAMVLDLDLTWILRDGVLWITTPQRAQTLLKTAVYDVRDLCRDEAESAALMDAVMSQTGGMWDEYGGPGAMYFARPGTLVVHHEERVLMKVLDLLEAYRTALLSSKPRDPDVVDPQEVITVYYRLRANVAQSLASTLPVLVQPASWRSASQPESQGEVLYVTSPAELFNDEGQLVRASSAKESENAQALVVSRAVLIIRQTRTIHDEIAEVIRRVKTGDASKGDGGKALGMGGFGGGFFSVSPRGSPRP